MFFSTLIKVKHEHIFTRANSCCSFDNDTFSQMYYLLSTLSSSRGTFLFLLQQPLFFLLFFLILVVIETMHEIHQKYTKTCLLVKVLGLTRPRPLFRASDTVTLPLPLLFYFFSFLIC